MSKTIYEILEETNPSYMDILIRFTEILEKRYKNLKL